jgi:hypothetical protein
MDKLKNIVAGALLTIAVFLVSLVGGLVSNKTSQPIQLDPIEIKMGAVPGLENTENNFSNGGVRQYYFNSEFNNASTTICNFKTPNATTTLTFGSVSSRTATATVLYIDIAKSSQPSATTTKLADTLTTTASTQFYAIASSTSSTYNPAMVIDPNQYIAVKYYPAADVSSTKNTIKGKCKFILVEM